MITMIITRTNAATAEARVWSIRVFKNLRALTLKAAAMNACAAVIGACHTPRKKELREMAVSQGRVIYDPDSQRVQWLSSVSFEDTVDALIAHISAQGEGTP